MAVNRQSQPTKINHSLVRDNTYIAINLNHQSWTTFKNMVSISHWFSLTRIFMLEILRSPKLQWMVHISKSKIWRRTWRRCEYPLKHSWNPKLDKWIIVSLSNGFEYSTMTSGFSSYCDATTYKWHRRKSILQHMRICLDITRAAPTSIPIKNGPIVLPAVIAIVVVGDGNDCKAWRGREEDTQCCGPSLNDSREGLILYIETN